MKLHRLLLLTLSAAALTSHAHAQSMKPGLWEVATQMHSAGGELEGAMAMMQKQMQSMPPEQRKKMEAMMAQNGVSVSGGSVNAKICVTKEMAARNDAPIQAQGNCTVTHSPMMGGRMHMSFTCTQPQSSGEGDITFNGDKAYSMTMHANGPQGAPQNMTMEGNGRWLSADCGAIKPLGR